MDGDKVIVKLKNRGDDDKKKQDSVEEDEWYEKAFGKKQNIMNIKIKFTPEKKENFKRGKNDIYAVVEYAMYDEM